MRRIRSAVALLIVAALMLCSLASLTSCDRSYDKEEVEAAARELLPKALNLYSLYYGNGLDYLSSGGFSDGDYREANPVSLRKYGFTTVAELKSLTLATFSEKYSENIFDKYLDSYEANDTVYSYARYTENSTGEIVLVHTKHDPIFEDRMSYILDSVSANDSTRDYINLSVRATVSSAAGESKEITLKFTMYEEKLGWRISSPCFGNYTEYDIDQ